MSFHQTYSQLTLVPTYRRRGSRIAAVRHPSLSQRASRAIWQAVCHLCHHEVQHRPAQYQAQVGSEDGSESRSPENEAQKVVAHDLLTVMPSRRIGVDTCVGRMTRACGPGNLFFSMFVCFRVDYVFLMSLSSHSAIPHSTPSCPLSLSAPSSPIPSASVYD